MKIQIYPTKCGFPVGPADSFTRKDNFPVKNCDNNCWYFDIENKNKIDICIYHNIW